jgi:hypothetical protein
VIIGWIEALGGSELGSDAGMFYRSTIWPSGLTSNTRDQLRDRSAATSA